MGEAAAPTEVAAQPSAVVEESGVPTDFDAAGPKATSAVAVAPELAKPAPEAAKAEAAPEPEAAEKVAPELLPEAILNVTPALEPVPTVVEKAAALVAETVAEPAPAPEVTPRGIVAWRTAPQPRRAVVLEDLGAAVRACEPTKPGAAWDACLASELTRRGYVVEAGALEQSEETVAVEES
ncbi:MAG: hypothetical protein ACRENY_04220 [Candidatus Dormibacteria bacterium]